ncbi:MAG: hypothetical protein K0R18_1164 [Bacillales bacterium]|jgi:hypothetical protein|nr:hypothetical protein [Bacillales bacterium]
MNKGYEIILNTNIKNFIESISFQKIGEFIPKTTIEKIEKNGFKINISFTLDKELPMDDWQLNIVPRFSPTFNWAPHLTPTNKHIIAQHSFRSPAMIVSDKLSQIVIIPNLELLEKSKVKWYMDMDAEKNVLTLGISDYSVDSHVLFVRKKGMIIPKGEVEFGFYLFLNSNDEALNNPFRNILSFLWENYGGKLFNQGNPINHSLEPYLNYTYDWAFNRWKTNVYQEFEIDGLRVGAPCFIVNITQSPNYQEPINEREMRSIWNQVWFSSLRSASGLFRYGKKFNRKDLIEKALLTKELALKAPMKNGVFPSVISTKMIDLEIDGKVYHRSAGWDSYYWGNSNRNPFSHGEIKTAPFHVLDMSFTCLLMLRWYTELEQDERLKTYALTYAQNLVKMQREDGYFPAWLDQESLKPMGVLDDSPETSLSVTFLILAYQVYRDETYLNCALKAINAVMKEIIPSGRWEDFETYWSCSSFGQSDQVGKKFSRNNMYKQCNFSMFWTAEALLQSYKVTHDIKYLKHGQRCLDEMLLTQSSWQPPFIHVNTLGGFGVMNGDGEWNDARQSLFAETIIEYGIELGITEYIERGIAALKASFVMMYCPENEKTKEQWEKRWPFFNEKDYGFMMENYGHDGITNEEGIGIGEFTIYDWGNGAASESYMRIVDHFGKSFINK